MELEGHVWSVSEVNQRANGLLQQDPYLSNIIVSGEITNYNFYKNSGHHYFTLKDDNCSLACAMFKSHATKLKFTPKDGQEVIAVGNVGVYERSGKYQFYPRVMQPLGLGVAGLALEELRQKLNKEGLFLAEYKKSIPFFPHRIGVVTSRAGAAIHDIIQVVNRRCPAISIVLASATVQGNNAPNEIVQAIARLDNLSNVDLIIVGRGGGSRDDLLAFNSEIVARAIFACRTPIISAVGHEVDVTLCDLVADVRAATPSAAAEMAVPEQLILHDTIRNLYEKMKVSLHNKLKNGYRNLEIYQRDRAFIRPLIDLDKKRTELLDYSIRLDREGENINTKRQQNLSNIAGQLSQLNPLTVLDRGYALVRKQKPSMPIKTVKEFEIGEMVEIILTDGSALAVIEDIKEGEANGS